MEVTPVTLPTRVWSGGPKYRDMGLLMALQVSRYEMSHSGLVVKSHFVGRIIPDSNPLRAGFLQNLRKQWIVLHYGSYSYSIANLNVSNQGSPLYICSPKYSNKSS